MVLKAAMMSLYAQHNSDVSPMALVRRSFIKGAGLASVAGLLEAKIGFGMSAKAKCSVILDTTGRAGWDNQMTETVTGFLEQNLPISVIVDFGRGDEAPPPIAAPLLDALASRPDLLELIAWNSQGTDLRGYFQMRHASDLARRMRQAFASADQDLVQRQLPVTVASPALSVPVGLNGYRVAGFRNAILVPASSLHTTDAGCPGPVTCASGGMRLPVSVAGDEFVRQMKAEARSGQDFQVFLDAGGEGGTPGDLGAALAAANFGEAATLVLPRDKIAAWQGDTSRRLALCLVAPPRSRSEAFDGFLELAQRLGDQAIKSSVVAGPDAMPVQVMTEVIPMIEAPGSDLAGWRAGLSDAGQLGIVATAGSDVPSQQLARAGLRHLLHIGPDSFEQVGLDNDGIYHLPVLGTLDGRADQDPMAVFGQYREGALIVPADAYGNRAQRNAIFTTLRGFYESSYDRPMTATEFVSEIQPPSPIYELMMETAARHDLIQPDPAPRPGPELDALLEDAQKAWSYFGTLSDFKTGFAPATVFVEEDYSSHHNTLTMWDIGSTILGLVSAQRLGLVPVDEARDQAGKIIESLGQASRAAGSRLPPAELDARYPWSVKRDFNSCDSGRLLTSLATLSRSPANPGGIDDLVSGWDLSGTVKDGVIHSIENGRFVRSDASHCTQYTASAYALWGLRATAPYTEAMRGYTGADAHMALLFRAAQFGLLGAEPLLLKALEIGLSEASEYLADVLFGAQVAENERSGAMVCVSEGPLPDVPWFSYQGLDIADRREPWKLTTLSNLSTYRTEKFRRANMMTSTKAAYLWLAYRPHPYSAKLVAYVRSRARREEAGFAAGIYQASGKPTVNYTDANTNGVILEAIAHMFATERSP